MANKKMYISPLDIFKNHLENTRMNRLMTLPDKCNTL